jgi:hypothetical protein
MTAEGVLGARPPKGGDRSESPYNTGDSRLEHRPAGHRPRKLFGQLVELLGFRRRLP